MGNGLFAAALMWALYLSIEPYVRRHWPQAIISWSRLLAGRVRDPLLGRDLLIGVLLGIVWLLIVEVVPTSRSRGSAAHPPWDERSTCAGGATSWAPGSGRS